MDNFHKVKDTFPKRAVHFDFHTMPGCNDIGSRFNAEEFVATLKKAKVEYINFFAKCNLGFCYYPTKIGMIYPELQFDLLGEIIHACQADGIRVAVYFNAGLSHEEALRHREWCIVNQQGQVYEFDKMDHWFRKLCFNSGYREHLLALVEEVLSNYPVDGLIFDSMNVAPCYGIECLEKMQARGLDPRSQQAVEEFAHETKLSMKQDIETLVKTHRDDDIYLYFLGVEACYQPTHIELEVLPQGGWGYDYLPSRIRYIRTLGKPYSTMTGRFQRSWGDMGGIRPEAALFYDCINSVANGGACCIGDHLAPQCALEPAVFDMIGRVYTRLADMDEWTENAKPLAEIAILAPWLGKDAHKPEQHMEILAGASRMLLELGCQYDVIDGDAYFSGYQVLFLPDNVRLSSKLAAKLSEYIDNGGSIICSGHSGLDEDGKHFAMPESANAVEFMGPETFNYTFLHCSEELAEGLPSMGLAVYEQGIAIKARNDGVARATLGRGYFNYAEWDFKHEYLYIPEKEMTDHAAVVSSASENLWHLAFPVALNYYNHAPVYYKNLLKNILKRRLPRPLLEVTNLPSYGVATVTTQPQRRMIHLMCYVPEKRGRIMEIVEEPSVAIDLVIRLRTDSKKTSRVYLAPSRQEVAYVEEEGYLQFKLDKLVGYQLIVVEFAP